MGNLSEYLNHDINEMNALIRGEGAGIPLDSIDGGLSEFQNWVKAAKGVNDDLKVAIKADGNTPYKTIKLIMNELRDINENRYYLITQYKTQED